MLQQINHYVLLHNRSTSLVCACVYGEARLARTLVILPACLPAKYSLATVPGCITPSANAYALQSQTLSHTSLMLVISDSMQQATFSHSNHNQPHTLIPGGKTSKHHHSWPGCTTCSAPGMEGRSEIMRLTNAGSAHAEPPCRQTVPCCLEQRRQCPVLAG
jgi:hypothetical protein